MKLVTYMRNASPTVGVVKDDNVIPLIDAAPSLPQTMKELVAINNGAQILAGALASASSATSTPLAATELLPVVHNPAKVICVGLNYADHAKEGGHDVPTYPALFMRAASSLAAHGQPLVRPRCSEQFDYEAELMIVIGKGGRYLRESEALDAVFGYTLFNDGSLRDYQRKGAQWTPGKNFDTTGPVGPWVVTTDELPAGAHGLNIESRLNGKVMQHSNTEQLIFPVAKIVEIVSEYTTLEPGDLIATGTPSGVGYPRNPPVFMREGDTIEVEIEGIGTLSNTIVDERV